MIFDKIESLLSQYDNIPESIKSGRKINPVHIISLTGFFTKLDLQKEEILLASYTNPETPNYIITDFNIYYVENKTGFQKPIQDFEIEYFRKNISAGEIAIVADVITLILNKKQENKKTLDDFINKYKDLIYTEKQNFENPDLLFDGKYVDMLLHESDEALNLCRELNSDAHFVQSLNLIFSGTNQAVEGYKAEHLFLADIIKAYNEVISNENEKSRFCLAYFFERLQGNNLAKGISIQRLNEMTVKDSFVENIEKIKSAKYIIPAKEYQNEYLLPSVLFRIQHSLFVKSGNLIYRFASIIAKADDSINENEKISLKNILDKTTKPKIKNNAVSVQEINEDDSLEKAMSELNDLVGLEEVKKSITNLINFLKIEKIRTEKGLENPETSLHSVFSGPPGTGKTTVARLLGRIYKHLGYLEKGHLTETDRAGLVAGYIGQTAIKVDEIINNSMGGVLFIDEAYSLTAEDNSRDFGSEAIDTLVKRMEDKRNEFVVIVAGYTEPMKIFIESNPGLRSRFNRFLPFKHYLPMQLLEIFKKIANKNDFILTEDASDKLTDMFELLYEKRDDGFGNGRVVRNIFEICIQNQANRLVEIKDLSADLLRTLEEEDIPEPKDMVEQVFYSVNEKED